MGKPRDDSKVLIDFECGVTGDADANEIKSPENGKLAAFTLDFSAQCCTWFMLPLAFPHKAAQISRSGAARASCGCCSWCSFFLSCAPLHSTLESFSNHVLSLRSFSVLLIVFHVFGRDKCSGIFATSPDCYMTSSFPRLGHSRVWDVGGGNSNTLSLLCGINRWDNDCCRKFFHYWGKIFWQDAWNNNFRQFDDNFRSFLRKIYVRRNRPSLTPILLLTTRKAL